MRLSIILVLLLLFPAILRAELAPVGQEMRSVEIGRQAEEQGRSLTQARSGYFDKVQILIPVDDQVRLEVEKLADRYKKRYLGPKREERLCQQAKGLLISDPQALNLLSCRIEDSILTIEFKP